MLVHVPRVCGGSTFLWQKGNSYPVSLSAKDPAKQGLSDGAIAVAECYYGEELYDMSLSAGLAGICNTFFGKGGYGYFGSTTIS